MRLIESSRSDRLWYQGDRLDLVMWPDCVGQPKKLELSQRLPYGNELLRWQQPEGFTWLKIDSGEDRPARHKAAALLHAAPPGELAVWRKRLEREGSGLPDTLSHVVQALLEG